MTFGILHNIRTFFISTDLCTHIIDVLLVGIGIPGTYHTTAAESVLGAILQSVLLLAATCCCSKIAPDRDSRVLVVLYRYLPPDMVYAYFAPVLFWYFSFSVYVGIVLILSCF